MKVRREVSLREQPFQLPESAPAWARDVKLAHREAKWMRVEIARAMQGIGLCGMPAGDYTLGMFTIVLRRMTVQRRGGSGPDAQVRRVPSLYDYVVDRRRLYVVNFCCPAAAMLIQETGLGSVPCGNPFCEPDSAGRWDTAPMQWSMVTSSPQAPPTPMHLPHHSHTAHGCT